jgi:hypothetical protein
MAKHTCAKTHNYKGSKKIVNNGESLNQTHCSCFEKKRQQTYNVIFIWDKRPKMNPKPNLKPNPKPSSTLY